MKSTRIFIPFFGDGHWVQGHLGNLPNLGNLPDLGAEKYRKVTKSAEKCRKDEITSDLYSVFWRWSLGPRAILR